MRYAAGHKDRIRDQIVARTARVIREGGPGEVAISGVMGSLGLTHGGFYAHFRSRDALITAAVTRMFEEAAGMLDPDRLAADPAAALGGYIRVYLSRTHRDAVDQGCPLPVLMTETGRLPPDAREVFVEGCARLTERIAQGLARMDRAKGDAPALAASLLSEMVGALALARAMRGSLESDALLRQSRAQVLARAGL